MSPAILRLIRALAAAELDAGYDMAGKREAVRRAMGEVNAEIGWTLNQPKDEE